MENINEGQTVSISLTDLFEVWGSVSKAERNERILQFVMSKSTIARHEDYIVKRLKSKIKLFSMKIEKKWKSAGSRKERFLLKYKDWLETEYFKFDFLGDNIEFSSSEDEEPIGATPGRPQKAFHDCSEGVKRQKVKDLLNAQEPSQLCYAAQMAIRASGSRTAADFIKAVSESPEEAKHLMRDQELLKSQRQYSREEALALYLDTKLTRNSYKILRKKAMSAGHHLYPSIYAITKAKKDCLPIDSSISVTETSAEVDVGHLCKITAERLLQTLEPVVASHVPDQSTLTLICKWGGDGSSGHSNYKQKFQEQNATDEYLFVLSFVPIQLRINDNTGKEIWQNLHPSSTRLCRPIKFLFAKETEQLSTREFEAVRSQIEKLEEFKMVISEKNITVKFDFLLTMIDGKIANYLTSHKSTQSCYICGAKPSEMNSYVISKQPNPEFYKYGLSGLHALIKMFECLLHISYRLDTKKWAVRDKQDKELFEARKKDIQAKFKSEMGLIVDKPKPGFGISNDGNTARRFFRNPEKSSEITGIDERIINRFSVILGCIASGHDIELTSFSVYLDETRNLYLELYNWYMMPPSVHKILCHGVEIIKKCIVPIGQLSEEAQEARNKDCRRFRLCNTQKTSRVNSNRDLLNMLLISSDPLINTFRETPLKNAKSFPKEVVDFLIEPQLSPDSAISTSSSFHDFDYTAADSTEYQDSDVSD